jgi:type IV pilus assembly protein PilV
MKRLRPLPRRAPRPLRNASRGFSLIEVLVALVIFAFGMLGLSALQARALTYGNLSLKRSQAVALTDDVLDRMRADRSNAMAERWDTDLDDAASSITGTDIYQTDLKDWKLAVESQLPSGKASINVDNGGTVTVTVQWDESNAAGGDDTQKMTTVSHL